MSNEVIELFGSLAESSTATEWATVVKGQDCPYLARQCIKVRKSAPDISIGTCSLTYGKGGTPIMICPFRFLERRQIFTDCLHLLTLHEPGNELHVVPEVSIPGGSVDYFLVTARDGMVVDFVGIELQTLDTTGTVWPARQRFLNSIGIAVNEDALASRKSFGINWKMTAKTILVQLHHKVETFEHLAKHLVLVVQDCLLAYMRGTFAFGHLNDPRLGDTMHFHAYAFERTGREYRIQLTERRSTDAAGVLTALGLQAPARVELDVILANIQQKMSEDTLWTPA